MQLTPPFSAAKPTRSGRLAAALGLALTLSACGDTSIGSNLFHFGASDAPKAEQTIDPKYIASNPTCPTAEIKYGTETIMLFESGKPGDMAAMRFQISVQRVARECDQVGDNIVARVGAAGRVLAGPKGATGKVDIPVRIAAVQGDKVVYTAVKIVSVQVEAPDFGANWSLVDEAVTIPAAVSADTIIYVGLDEKGKPGVVSSKKQKPKVTKG